MNREYHKWYSPAVEREMELLIFGHAGPRMLAFPTRQQRFFEYEDRGMIAALEPALETGALQLLCLDGLDDDSFYAFDKPAEARIARHLQYEQYVLQEVLPFFEKRAPGTPLTAHGCSLGAFHAMAIALRHPQHFQRVLAFSGRYDLSTHLGDFHTLFYGYDSDNLKQLMPTRFMPELKNTARLRQIRKLKPVIVIGEEDPFCEDNLALSAAFKAKKVPHELHFWCGNAHRFRYWRHMARVYLGLTRRQ